MNFQVPYRVNQIDLNKITYSKIKNIDKKRIIYIKYNDKNNQNQLVFQPPTLLTLYKPIKITDEYHEIEFPFITHESNKASKFIDFLEKLDDKIIQDAKINSKAWFSDITNTDKLKYKRTIKESEVHNTGIIKIKIIKNVDFETILLNEQKKKIYIDNIQENTWCKMLLEIYAVVITQTGTFSLFIRPVVLSFKNKEINNYNYNFLEDTEENEDIPDSDVNNIFIKQHNHNKPSSQNTENNHSSTIQIDQLSQLNNLLVNTKSKYSSSSSSEELEKLSSSTSSDEENEQQNDNDLHVEDLENIDKLDKLSSSEDDEDQEDEDEDQEEELNNLKKLSSSSED